MYVCIFLSFVLYFCSNVFYSFTVVASLTNIWLRVYVFLSVYVDLGLCFFEPRI